MNLDVSQTLVWQIHMDKNTYTIKAKCHKVSLLHENDCEETISLEDFKELAGVLIAFTNSIMIMTSLFIVWIVRNGK